MFGTTDSNFMILPPKEDVYNTEPEENTPKSNLVDIMNGFLADEFIAACQYLLNKAVAKGKCLDHLNKLFEDSYADELAHFQKLLSFAQSVGMDVSVSMPDLMEKTAFPFQEINSEEDTTDLVHMMIDSENAAITGYEAFLRSVDFQQYPDLGTVIGEICAEEREHKKELEDLLSSLGETHVSHATSQHEDESEKFITPVFDIDNVHSVDKGLNDTDTVVMVSSPLLSNLAMTKMFKSVFSH